LHHTRGVDRQKFVALITGVCVAVQHSSGVCVAVQHSSEVHRTVLLRPLVNMTIE